MNFNEVTFIEPKNKNLAILSEKTYNIGLLEE